MKRRAAILGTLLLALASPARADTARAYFDIGAKAYEAGRYLDAAHAFEEAYRLSKRPGLLFSLGQANRMEFFARSDPARLRDAVHYYKLYVQQAPSGDRVKDATAALTTLAPLLEKLGDAASSPYAPAASGKPRVMISSPTEGAQITFDGKRVSDPYMAEVAAGKHQVVLSAPGYKDYRREIVVDEKNGVPPLDIALEEKPARLVINAPEGADVTIDGRLQGTTPLPPLGVASGTHFIAVTLNGHGAFSRTVALQRGEQKTLDAELHVTGQRTASWVLMGVGAGGIVAGGVLGYVALKKDSDAKAIQNADSSQGNLPPGELGRYNSLRQSRDNFRLASVIAFGAGAGVAAVGLVLHAFDQPKPPLPPLEQTTPGAPRRTTPEPGFEISAAPLWQPGFVGASAGGRF